jgi:hypothetical protein
LTLVYADATDHKTLRIAKPTRDPDATIAIIMSALNDDENPYEGHPALTPLQAQILNEYAKLNRSLKSVRKNTYANTMLRSSSSSETLFRFFFFSPNVTLSTFYLILFKFSF